MTRYLTKALVFAAAAAMSAALPIVSAGPAQADDCQPEELILGGGNSPYDDSNSPLCPVMRGVVYPALDCPTGTTLIGCMSQLSPVPVTNPLSPTGPINDQVAFYLNCTLETLQDGGETLLCRPYV